MQQVLKQAIEQMVRLGNALNWNPPIDHEYVNALNDLRALRDATQPRVQSDDTSGHPVADAVQELIRLIESDEA